MPISRQQQIVTLLINLKYELSRQDSIELTTECIDNLTQPELNDFMINVALNQFLKEMTNLIGFEGLKLNQNAAEIVAQLKELSLKKTGRSPLSSLLFSSLFGNW
ncbi:hypothetical protein [Latilactobacillus fuchuensis]|nr:hypothetical protein [Latilactobacillus fuchuensis]MCP8858170.1 hypothetical protein [Latilactobacillus fuchuensis]SPC36912.1 hypothetical protein LFUMFP_130001 [Latilactobacillus fuchuensis]